MTLSNLLRRLAVFGLLALSLGGIVTARAARNDVPVVYLGLVELPIDANALKPPECAHLDLVTVVAGSGNFSGGEESSLILGSPDDDRIKAGKGTDCVMGGGGDDDLRGQGADDVLLGGAGDDSLNGNAGYDICYGGSGDDDFSNCEERIQ